MSVKIRFKRVGMPKQPFYRLVAIDTRSARNGKELEVLGHYSPRDSKTPFTCKSERIRYWVSCGARLSDTAKSILVEQGFFAKTPVPSVTTEKPSVT